MLQPMEIWDDCLIRQLVDTVKVISPQKIVVCLPSGTEIQQELQK